MPIYLRDALSATSSTQVDTPTGGLDKGELVQLGSSNVYGFAFTGVSDDSDDTALYDDQVTIITKARQAVATKASGTGSPTFAIGDAVYYDVSTQLATSSSVGTIKVGYALEAADESAESVFIEFDGTMGV